MPVVTWALLLSLLVLPACARTSGDGPAGDGTPTLRLSSARGPSAAALRLQVPEGLRGRFGAAVDSVSAVLEEEETGGDPRPVRVRIDDGSRALPAEVASGLARPEAFWIELTADSVSVVGSDTLGALHGLTRLEELKRSREDGLPTGRIVDWPVHRVRAAHFVLRNVGLDEAKRIVSLARRAQFNTLVVQLADGVAFPSMGEIPRSDAWSVEEFRSFLDYVRQNGLRFIPELQLLTHQEKLFRGAYPELLYNGYTYDPRKEETYERVFAIMDEIISLSDPDAFHIGHDEVEGPGKSRSRLKEGETPLPAELFLQDVERLHRYLSEKGIETWMWGDMLISAREFPGMLSRHLHGDRAYADLRGRLPRDIVVTDWHYDDGQEAFPSSAAFLRAGHDVLGSTWKNERTTRAFSRYVAGLGPGARGMVATTWWHVQRDDWAVVEEILRTSGAVFWDPTGDAAAGDRAGGP